MKELFYVLVIVLVFVGFFTVIKPTKISGNAMNPNYHANDKWLVNKLQYYFVKPNRGDVIMFEYYNLPNFKYMGRIIGLPNEKVIIKNGKVLINGVELQEKYLPTNTITKTMKPVKEEKISDTVGKLVETTDKKIFEEGIEFLIPENQYFVLGDNRENSYDSRSLGFVEEKDIIGPLFLKY